MSFKVAGFGVSGMTAFKTCQTTCFGGNDLSRGAEPSTVISEHFIIQIHIVLYFFCIHVVFCIYLYGVLKVSLKAFDIYY